VPPDDAVVVGDDAPAWSGPLVGGGTFDMADQVGKYVLVYNWSPHYGVIGLDYLYDFQLLSDSHSAESLTFVSVSEDTLAETKQVLDRMEITVATVHCGWDPDQVCLPESPWFLWRNGIPSVTVIDPDGIVVAVFDELPFDGELEQLLGDISS
jgi:peroxiredoxin